MGFEYVFSYFDIITVLLCFVVLVLLSSWLLRPANNLPLGPWSIPILGSLPYLVFEKYKSPVETFRLFAAMARTYGDIFSLNIFGQTIVILNTHETIKQAFQNPLLSDRPLNKLAAQMNRIPGVLNACGESWKEQRRFSLRTLRGLGVGKRSFEEQIAEEAKTLLGEVKRQQGQPFDPQSLIGNAVSNVICAVIFGRRYEYTDEDFKELLKNLNQLIAISGDGGLFFIIIPVTVIKYLRPKAYKAFREQRVRQFVSKIIESHRARHDPEHPRDFIDVFLSEIEENEKQNVHSYLSDQSLITTVIQLFSAGSETTATTLRWALLYMMTYPNIQSQVHGEIDRKVGRDRLPRLSDVPNLPFTGATLLEIQRIATILPSGGPHCAAETTELNGYTIPKGTILVANLWAVHHDSKVWKDPSMFNPSRFLDSSGNVIQRPELIPFATGRRVCLGENLAKMELFLFFTHMMHQFSFTSPTDTSKLSFEGISGLTYQPRPFDVVVTPRQ